MGTRTWKCFFSLPYGLWPTGFGLSAADGLYKFVDVWRKFFLLLISTFNPMRLFFETLFTTGQSKKHSWLANRISTCQGMSDFSGYKGVPFVALQLAASEPICICWTKYSLPEFSDIKKFFSSKTPNDILKSKCAVFEWKTFLKKEKKFYYQKAKNQTHGPEVASDSKQRVA